MENFAIQAQLGDLFVDALDNERTRHVMIKEAPIRLSVAIDLAKYSDKVWEKTKNRGMRVHGREDLGNR